MSLHSAPRLNAARRRARKYSLARRDGARCAYCRHPFEDLREATMDHVVPVSLFRSWSASALVLACHSCNQAKADRLPLSIALLLVWSTDRTQTGVHVVDPAFTAGESAFTPDRPVFMSEGPVFTGPGRSADSPAPGGPAPLGPERVNWLLLARLVHAHTTAAQSTPDRHGPAPNEQRRARVGRVAHRPRLARPNACERSIDRGVSR